MKRKCDQCDKPATHHSVEIIKGQKIEKHLCDVHAAEEGLSVKGIGHTPINELLTNFVKLHSGAAAAQELRCDQCGMTFTEFREHSLLGCPHCYAALKVALMPLVERAQEGGTHHIGKTPHRAGGGGGEQRQEALLQLRKRLSDAVTSEDYELAARLRDEVKRYEEPQS